ncbi:class I SAM-dependent methyltransferase [Flexivirga oryzae]|uniref:Putative O-methyltransferase YrrM n=1 Tax=Flexivirga oryzae TaxID=1794944 RepID=A0A839N823_9MICO|nr:class I SAM-dependent methyltransferase [Flexivirga oryzae]MBB2891365.1 putative O-methyltransferase YrrM [Flexivirga oryzae]
MQTSRVFDAVAAAFPGDPQSTDPIDPLWQRLAEEVEGFTGTNELAVLNAAAAALPDDEAYLEVGTFKGRSLVAAVQGNERTRFYAIENFLEFGMTGQDARAELQDNLERLAGDADVHLLEGDAFTLMAQPGVIDRPIGVYFYDGDHTLLAHYLALAVVEPLLADEALVLVDDASWKVVQRAHRLFLRRHPGWKVVRTWDVTGADDLRWANGMHALVFRRSDARGRSLSRTDEGLRRYQTVLQDKINKAAWKFGTRLPAPVKQGLVRLTVSRARSVGGDDH